MMEFRIWDNENNRYYEPTYEAYKNNLEDLHIGLGGDVCMRTMDKFIHCPSVMPNRFEAEQYTTLKDEDDIKIFNGDILSNGYNCKGVVRFHNGMFLVDMVYDESVLTKDNDTATFRLVSVASVTKVIGNVHENSELIK